MPKAFKITSSLFIHLEMSIQIKLIVEALEFYRGQKHLFSIIGGLFKITFELVRLESFVETKMPF